VNKFWNFKANGKSAELYIYGEIASSTWYGDEVTPVEFQKELAALGDVETIDVYINSGGGDAFAGITIYNILKRHKAQIVTHNDALAASAASVIFMSGDKRISAKNALVMIHFASTFVYGNKTDLKEIIGVLETLDEQLAQIYADRTGLNIEEIKSMLEAETWMDGDTAKDKGFADEVEENKKIAACASKEIFAKYKHPPEILTEDPPDGGFSLPDETDNGGASQPVEDNATALAAQKDRFLRTKLNQHGGK